MKPMKRAFLLDNWELVTLDELVEHFPGAWGQDTEFEGSTAISVVGTSHINNRGVLNPSDSPISAL